MGDDILWGLFWAWQYVPCSAAPVAFMPSASGDETRGGKWPKPLGFTRDRTPCVSTLHQGFSRLDREAFELALGQWLQQRGLKAGEAVVVEGKSLRGIHGEQLPGVRLVAAYAHQTRIVVGQQAVAEKENGLGTLPGLRSELDLQGRVVTGDGQFTQREECRQIVGQGGTPSSR